MVKRPAVTQDPDWRWLESLLQTTPGIDPSPRCDLLEDDLEYFPGNDMLADGVSGNYDIFAMVTDMSVLIRANLH